MGLLPYPFWIKLVLAILGITFQFFKIQMYCVWLRITEDGSVPKIRIWSIVLIKSDRVYILIEVSFYILAAGIVELIKLIIQLKQQQQRQQQQDPLGALINKMMKFKFVKELIS